MFVGFVFGVMEASSTFSSFFLFLLSFFGVQHRATEATVGQASLFTCRSDRCIVTSLPPSVILIT